LRFAAHYTERFDADSLASPYASPSLERSQHWHLRCSPHAPADPGAEASRTACLVVLASGHIPATVARSTLWEFWAVNRRRMRKVPPFNR